MNYNNIVGVACAELRSLRRGTRLYVVVALSFSAGLWAIAYAFLNHLDTSHVSPSAAGVNPRFLVGSFGVVLLCALFFGIVFLGFDSRARDARAGIAEVLHVRALSNLDLVLGRAVALFVTGWLPLLLFVACLQLAGAIANEYWIAGTSFEANSAAKLLFVDAPVALLLWCSIVMLLAAALPRAAVLVVSLAVLGILAGVFLQTPLYLLPMTSMFGDVGTFASDIAPNFVRLPDIARAGALLTLAVGFLAMAAAAYDRPDVSSTRYLVGGSTAALIGIGAIGAGVVEARDKEILRETWAAVHARLEDHPRPDLERVTGPPASNRPSNWSLTLISS